MTNKEAINQLCEIGNVLQIIPNSLKGEALKMAIKALEQESVLEKIKAEIMQVANQEKFYDEKWALGLRYAVNIIDKYKAENEDMSQQLEAVKVIKMRQATPEERESIDEYIKSISKPIGVYFWDLEQESILDKIRAEIEQAADKQFQIAMGVADLNERYTHIRMENAYRHSLNIIDKYKEENEDKE